MLREAPARNLAVALMLQLAESSPLPRCVVDGPPLGLLCTEGPIRKIESESFFGAGCCAFSLSASPGRRLS